jgi:DNA-binding MarR family transcriptional regulator
LQLQRIGYDPRMGSGISATRMRAWRSFLEAHARVTDALAAELEAETSLPLTWYDVLVQLSEADDNRLRMQDLARAVLLSKSGLTRLVDRMTADGLVTREPCLDDRRGTFVCLSPAGRERLDGASPVHLRGIAEHFTSHLNEQEARELHAFLDRILQANLTTAPAG